MKIEIARDKKYECHIIFNILQTWHTTYLRQHIFNLNILPARP